MDTIHAIFVVTEENGCPLYNTGEEFLLEDLALTPPRAKPVCLVLAAALRAVTCREDSPDGGEAPDQESQECGGCGGMLHFARKRDKGYATLPMQLLAATQRREKHEHFGELIEGLRATELFAALPDNDLEDLASILRLKAYDPGAMILQQGETGARLCILLSGQVEIIAEGGGRLSLLESGQVFGEMSLLGGTPVSTSVRAVSPCRIAELHSKDFRHLLTRYLALQIFFYRLLAERLSDSNRQRAQEQAAGLAGRLREVGLLELLQLCHTSRKTGRLLLDFPTGTAELLFREGELVAARHDGRQGTEAFFRLIPRKEGRFVYASGLSEAEARLQPLGPFVVLLMQGMQYSDESGLLAQ